MSDVRAAAERVLACDVWYPRDRRHVELMTPDWENAVELARMVLEMLDAAAGQERDE